MLGIFGGSFDPIHFGHIKSALTLLEHFDFEKIRFIPCQLSPLKEKVYASEKHRWQMINLVCNSEQKLIADNRELKRKGPSYTIDTLIELREEFGNNQSLALIVGVDAFLRFSKWHRYEEILSYCHIMLMQRPGYSLPDAENDAGNKAGNEKEKKYYEANKTEDSKSLTDTSHGKIFMSDLEKFDISSTLIRKTVSQGKQPKYMLPGSVWNYIQRNELYKQ